MMKKVYKYVYTKSLDYHRFDNVWHKKQYSEKTSKNYTKEMSIYEQDEKNYKHVSITILIDILGDTALTKSSKGYVIRELSTIDLKYIYESDNLNLHDMFCSGRDSLKIAKEIIKQEIDKLKNGKE